MPSSLRTLALIWFLAGIIPIGHTIARQVFHQWVSWLPRLTFYTSGLSHQSGAGDYWAALTQIHTVVLDDAEFTQEIPRDFAWVPLAAWAAPVGVEVLLEILALAGFFSSGRSGATKRMRQLRKLAGRKDWNKCFALIKKIEEEDTGLLSEGVFLELKLITGDTSRALGQFPRALVCYRDVLAMRPDNRLGREGAVGTIIDTRKDIPHDWMDTYARVLKDTSKPSGEMVRLYAASQLHRVRADKKGADTYLTVFTDLKGRPDIIEGIRAALEELMTEGEDAIKARMVLGRELVAARQYDKAIKILDRMLLLEPGLDGVHDMLFEMYQEMERLPDLAQLYKQTLPRLRDSPGLARGLDRLRRVVGKELGDALRPGSRESPPAPSIAPAKISDRQAAPAALGLSPPSPAPADRGGVGVGPAAASAGHEVPIMPAAAPTPGAAGFSIEGLRQIVRSPSAASPTGPMRPLSAMPGAGLTSAAPPATGPETAGTGLPRWTPPPAASPAAAAPVASTQAASGGFASLDAQLGTLAGSPRAAAASTPITPGAGGQAADDGSLESLRNLLRGGTAMPAPVASGPGPAPFPAPAGAQTVSAPTSGLEMDLSALLAAPQATTQGVSQGVTQAVTQAVTQGVTQAVPPPAIPPASAAPRPTSPSSPSPPSLSPPSLSPPAPSASTPPSTYPASPVAPRVPESAESPSSPAVAQGFSIAGLPTASRAAPTSGGVAAGAPAPGTPPAVVESFRSAVHVYNTGDRSKAISLLQPLAKLDTPQRQSILTYLASALLDEGRPEPVSDLLIDLVPGKLSDEEAYLLGTRCELWDLIDWARELYRTIVARTPAFRDVAARLAALAEPAIPEAQIEEDLIRRLPARYKGVKISGRDDATITFIARDIELEREVSIKMLAPMRKGNPTLEKRFVAEARALAKLVHPNIVQIYDISREGIPFFSMEALDGWTLDKVMEQGTVALARRLRYVADALAALEYCHNRGVVHRDVRPENIFVTRSDEVRLLGFGQARIADVDETGRPDRGRTTLVYLAPEQLARPSTDVRSDLFSVGCVLFFVVMGEPPFVDVPSVMSAPTPSIAGRPGVTDALARIVTRCLEKTPEARFQSSREVIDALGPFTRG